MENYVSDILELKELIINSKDCIKEFLPTLGAPIIPILIVFL